RRIGRYPKKALAEPVAHQVERVVATSLLIEDRLEIPLGLRTLADFRAWALSDNFPDKGRIDYLQGRIEVDMSPEDLFSHGTPKSEIHYVVYGRVRRLKSGFVFLDCTRISCPAADL